MFTDAEAGACWSTATVGCSAPAALPDRRPDRASRAWPPGRRGSTSPTADRRARGRRRPDRRPAVPGRDARGRARRSDRAEGASRRASCCSVQPTEIDAKAAVVADGGSRQVDDRGLATLDVRVPDQPTADAPRTRHSRRWSLGWLTRHDARTYAFTRNLRFTQLSILTSGLGCLPTTPVGANLSAAPSKPAVPGEPAVARERVHTVPDHLFDVSAQGRPSVRRENSVQRANGDEPATGRRKRQTKAAATRRSPSRESRPSTTARKPTTTVSGERAAQPKQSKPKAQIASQEQAPHLEGTNAMAGNPQNYLAVIKVVGVGGGGVNAVNRMIDAG